MRNSKILMTRQARVVFVHFLFCCFFLFFFSGKGVIGDGWVIFLCVPFLKLFFIGRRRLFYE